MASIDGLSSGLDTTTIIAQLMQLERVPQTRLKTQQTAAESSISTLRTLNTKFLTIVTAAQKLGAAAPPVAGAAATSTTPTDWQLTSASSSDSTRTSASAVTGAPTAALSFHVQQLATAASHLSGPFTGKDAVLAVDAQGVAHTSLLLSQGDGAPITLTTDGTLASTVSAVNAANAGVTASLVQVTTSADPAQAQYRLQLTSTTTGAASTISLQAPGEPPTSLLEEVLVEGRDAVLDLGQGVLVTRSSNTVSDVLEGVTLTLRKADTQKDGAYVEPPVTVAVTRDVEGVAARVQALVDAANAARKEAKELTAFDPVTKTKGRLYGDSTTRSLVDLVRTAVVGDTAGPSLAGVTVARDGTVSFDKATFLKALQADPAAVEAALGKDGMAGRLRDVADLVSRGDTAAGGPGLITSAIRSRERQVKSLEADVASWDNRLAMKEKMLQRQYTALETALGKAQSQGQWLAGQLAALPSYGGQ